MKNKLVFASFIALLLVLAGCGKKLGSEEVELGGKVIEKGDKIIIEGESNLLPGSRLVGMVLVDDGEEVYSDTTELVSDKGKFNMEMDHHQYGDAEVVITFDFAGMQEEEVVRNYGEGGKKMEGPFVYIDKHWDDLQKKAEVRVALTQDDDTKTHQLTAPDWGKKPKDYGDPRVWIEAEEITTDKEFFYVKGKSNLLEASHIKGQYSNTAKQDETRVKPDGTFEMKIPYEYSEEPYFLFTFRPSSGSQWNHVREAYGEEGQKLVGKHVETSSNVQMVRVEVDYKHEDE